MTIMHYTELKSFIDFNGIKKINIIGSPASGKSTLSQKLAIDLGYKLIDLDEYLYDSRCKRLSLIQDEEILTNLASENNIIIDGTYSSSIQLRANNIDLFVSTKSSVLRCLSRFFRRAFFRKNLKCGERITLKTLKLIINWKKRLNQTILVAIPNSKLICFSDYE